MSLPFRLRERLMTTAFGVGLLIFRSQVPATSQIVDGFRERIKRQRHRESEPASLLRHDQAGKD